MFIKIQLRNFSNISFCLFILINTLSFNFVFSQIKDVKLKTNELLCTKVLLTSGENRVFELTEIFKSNLKEDINLGVVKYINLNYRSSIDLCLLTPYMISTNRIGFQSDKNFRLIIFELNNIYYFCYPRVLDELGFEYKIIQENLILKIDNKILKKRIKHKEWKKTIIELKYSNEEKKYKYLRYLIPNSSNL